MTKQQYQPKTGQGTVGNPNCDGSGPHTGPEVRVLPTGGDGNAILCRACLGREVAWRRERIKELAAAAAFDLPAWESLRVYGEDGQ